MAVMTTVLTDFSRNGLSQTYTLAGHTVAKPRIVLQKRKIPSGNQTVSENSIQVVFATEDAAGNILPSKVVFEVVHRSPIDGDSADVTAALAVFRDIVAGDEFGASVLSAGKLV